jgi:hypothetical protein
MITGDVVGLLFQVPVGLIDTLGSAGLVWGWPVLKSVHVAKLC